MQKNNRVVKSVLILSIVFCSMLFVVSAAAYTEYTQKTLYKSTVEPAVRAVRHFIQGQKQVSEDLKKAEKQAEIKKKQQEEEIKKYVQEIQQQVKEDLKNQKQAPSNVNYQNRTNTYNTPQVYPTVDKSKNDYEDDYEQRVKQMQEEADKRYKKALEEQQKWAEEQRKASKERMDAYKAESQKNLEEWKKEHGF